MSNNFFVFDTDIDAEFIITDFNARDAVNEIYQYQVSGYCLNTTLQAKDYLSRSVSLTINPPFE